MTSSGRLPNFRVTLPTKMLHNFPFPVVCEERNVTEALNFPLREGDVFLSHYPFGISDWVIQCLWKITTITKERINFDGLTAAMECVEVTGSLPFPNNDDPRLVRSNLPYSLLSRNPNAKYIYVTRNPKDVLVSYYLNEAAKNMYITFDQFFEDFMSGIIPYGNYFSHLRSWYENFDSNILFVNYETMHVHPIESVLKIANFISPEHLRLCRIENFMNYILQYNNDQDHRTFTIEGNGDLVTNLKTLKIKQLSLTRSYHFNNFVDSLPLDKAISRVGIWKNYLNDEQCMRINNELRVRVSCGIHKNDGDLDFRLMSLM